VRPTSSSLTGAARASDHVQRRDLHSTEGVPTSR
jgi:hypothetical protein